MVSWFGIKSPAPFSSASALFAKLAFLSTALVSSTVFGDNSGRLFYGLTDSKDILPHRINKAGN